MAPVEIRGKLEDLRRRLRTLFLVDGLGRLAAVCVAVLTACIFFDWLTSPKLPQFMRWTMLLGAMLSFAWVAWRRLISPLRIRMTEDDMALAVERGNPQLGDRLISTVQLSRDELRPDFAASRELVGALVSETSAATASMDFRRTLDARAVRTPVLAGTVALLFALTVTALAPGQVRTGLMRFLAPFGDTAWQSRTRLVTGELPLLLARGDSLQVEFDQEGFRRGRGTLNYRLSDSGGDWQRQRMLADDDGRLRARLERLTADVEFFAEAGDGRSATSRVEVVDRPRAEEVTVLYRYPVYTGREPQLGSPGQAAVSALVGTRVRIRAKLNQKVSRARLVIEGQTPRPMILESAGRLNLAVGEFTVSRDGRYRIELQAEHFRADALGRRRRYCFTDGGGTGFKVRAEADRAPEVRLNEPGGDMNVLPQAVVDLAASAKDDYGIAGARLRWSVGGGGKEDTRDLLSPGFGTTSAGMRHRWDLAGLKLKPGQTVSYRVTARDYFPKPGPNVGSSQIYHLRVIDRETFEGEKADARDRIRRGIAEVLRMERGNRGQVDSLREDLLGGSPFNTRARTDAATAESEQRAIGRRTAAVAAEIDRLLTRMEVNRASTAVDERELGTIARDLRGLSGREMPSAADSIREGRNAGGEEDRSARLGEASGRQAKIIDELARVLGRTEKWKESDELLRLARALLVRQTKIKGNTVAAGRSGDYRAAGIAALPREAKNRLEHLRRSQVGAAGDMAVLEEKMVTALGRLKDALSRGSVATALKIARDLEAPAEGDAPPAADPRSVEAAMRSAADCIIGLKLGRAAGGQVRIIGALERIIAALWHREKRDRDAAGRDLRNVRDRIDRALKRQDGHIADTGKLPGRDGGNRPGPGSPEAGKPSKDAGQVRREQARTRAMAEVIRKELERIAQQHGMPRMNRTADRAGSASSSMSQAEGHLGRGQPGSAKDDEEDARDELQRMQREVKEEIDRNQDQQHSEELFRIEKELKEILARHNEVILSTLEVERARSAAGDRRLGRPQKTRLFNASKTETEILGRTRALVRQLTDSPVFRWVLDDTAGDMHEVCRQLGRERTGLYVQDVEKDVKRNLEELIAALKEERKKTDGKKPPASPPGNGPPPPAGKPPLVPPLAELKMIRTMQEKVNRKTAWVDEAVSRTKDRRLSSELRRVLERTAQKQAEVAKVTDDLARMLEKPAACPGPAAKRGAL